MARGRKGRVKEDRDVKTKEASQGLSPALILAQGGPVTTFTRSGWTLLGIPPSRHPAKGDSSPFYPDGCFCYSTVLYQMEGCRRKRKRKGYKKPIKLHHLLHCLLLLLLLLLLGQPLVCAGYVQRYVSHVCTYWILITPIAVLLFYRWDLVMAKGHSKEWVQSWNLNWDLSHLKVPALNHCDILWLYTWDTVSMEGWAWGQVKTSTRI